MRKYTYGGYSIILALMLHVTVPAHAAWASDISSHLPSVSGWFSQPSDSTKNAFVALMSATALCLSAYIMYMVWHKRNAAHPPRDPNLGPRVPPYIPQPPPLIVVEPGPVVPEPEPRAPVLLVPEVPDIAGQYQVLPGNADPSPAELQRLKDEQPAEVAQPAPAVPAAPASIPVVVAPVSVPAVIEQPALVAPTPQEAPVVVAPVISCPAPQGGYLSWYDQAQLGMGPQTPVAQPPSAQPADLQADLKRAAHEDLTDSQEWDHVSPDDVPSPIGLIDQEKDLIERGREISYMVCNGEQNELDLDEARALMWYIWQESVPKYKSELTIRVEDTPDRRLYNALRNCKNENGESVVYLRGSSHFPGQVEGDKHYGIRGIQGLPQLLHDKRTILFAPLIIRDELRVHLSKKDNTVFYLKPENYGAEGLFTPAYERGILEGVAAGIETLYHGIDYLISKSKAMLDSGANEKPEYAKEHKPQKIAAALRACKEYVDTEQQTLCEELARRKDVTILEMHDVIGRLKANPGEDDKLAAKINELSSVVIEEYPDDRLKDIGVLNGREIFARLARKKPAGIKPKMAQPQLVDLEAGIDESASPRALHALLPHHPRAVTYQFAN